MLDIVNRTTGSKTESIFPFTIPRLSDRTRGLVMVQDGCESFCSYCVLPYIRGPVVSRPLPDIIEEVNLQTGNGCREIVITGIHTGSYGKDLKSRVTVADVLEAILDIEGDFRIRLSSIEINEIDDRIISLIRDNKQFCPHLPIPLQSGSDSVLARMNRKYTSGFFIERIAHIREQIPLCAVTTDIMVGFPGETDNDFESTLKTAETAAFSRIHVFPYSIRKGTKAADMKPAVPDTVKKERVNTVMSLAQNLKEAYVRMFIGKTLTVLAETFSRSGNILKGYSENYLEVLCKGDKSLVGTLKPVKIVKEENGNVWGEIIKTF
jgi:threonylcarbamoyladenosine tRNA methylthiotransferase MtaB